MRGVALLLLISIVAGCADDPEALKGAARKGAFPATFSSHESALEYVRQLYVGGRVDRVRIGMSSFLVVFQHGSGFPVVRIGVYHRQGLHWKLVAEPRPPSASEHLAAAASDTRIVVRGERSGQAWLLYDPDDTKG